jgi:hypothetical protein
MLADVRLVVDQPQWDFTVFCRLLAERVPAAGGLPPGELARVVEELIDDLRSGVDRSTGEPFRTPLLNDRGDLINNYFRSKLLEVAEVLSGSDYSKVMCGSLRMVDTSKSTDDAGTDAAPASSEQTEATA